VFDIVIPPKFKVPEFEKYKGASCPQNHLTMYCKKMVAHVGDEKLLITLPPRQFSRHCSKLVYASRTSSNQIME